MDLRSLARDGDEWLVRISHIGAILVRPKSVARAYERVSSAEARRRIVYWAVTLSACMGVTVPISLGTQPVATPWWELALTALPNVFADVVLGFLGALVSRRVLRDGPSVRPALVAVWVLVVLVHVATWALFFLAHAWLNLSEPKGEAVIRISLLFGLLVYRASLLFLAFGELSAARPMRRIAAVIVALLPFSVVGELLVATDVGAKSIEVIVAPPVAELEVVDACFTGCEEITDLPIVLLLRDGAIVAAARLDMRLADRHVAWEACRACLEKVNPRRGLSRRPYGLARQSAARFVRLYADLVKDLGHGGFVDKPLALELHDRFLSARQTHSKFVEARSEVASHLFGWPSEVASGPDVQPPGGAERGAEAKEGDAGAMPFVCVEGGSILVDGPTPEARRAAYGVARRLSERARQGGLASAVEAFAVRGVVKVEMCDAPSSFDVGLRYEIQRLEPGATSDVLETSVGFHVLRRLGQSQDPGQGLDKFPL